MGSCVSLRKDPESAIRFRLAVGTGAGKGRAMNGAEGLSPRGFDLKTKQVDAVSGIRSPGFGSKDENFFDSQAWLESDCEDDFLSVNGDFTPSCGSTPNFQTSTPVKPQLDKAFSFDGFPDTKSEPSPRKKLSELLQETLHGESGENDNNITNGKIELNGKSDVNGTNKDQLLVSLNGTPYLSGVNSACNGERTPNADHKNGKEKRRNAMQCCLPNLVHSLSVSERKKQTASPVSHTGG